jgi:hypothetical protein
MEAVTMVLVLLLAVVVSSFAAQAIVLATGTILLSLLLASIGPGRFREAD